MAAVKSLYRGTFNYPHQLFVIRRMAYSKEQARVLMCRHLAKRHDVDIQTVLAMFPVGNDNHTIELEVEVTEVDS